MTEEIKYNGLTTVPSDYECNDGDLSGAVNTVIEDGAVKPVYPPKTIFTPESGYRVVYIHKVGESENYILYGTDEILAYYDSARGRTIEVETIQNIKSVNAIGNTLVVIADSGIHYVLWKADKKLYTYLGTQIPELDISFGLQGHPRFYSISRDDDQAYDFAEGREGFFTIEHDAIEDEKDNFSKDNRKKITDQVLAKVNAFVAEQTVNKGRFCFPFFIRYALRLYDGTLVNHSAPIYMMPSTEECPVVLVHRFEKEKTTADIMLVTSDIDYRILPNQSAIKDEWSDIVKDVVVYVSKPIYSYDQNGECKRFANKGLSNNHFVGIPYIGKVSKDVGEDVVYLSGSTETEATIRNVVGKYYEWRWDTLYALYRPKIGDGDRRDLPPMKRIELPIKETKTIEEDVNSVSAFYLLDSFAIEETDFTSNQRKVIEIDKEYLQSLTSREVMTDDYLSHDRKIPSYTFAFNNRLNIANVSRELYKGFNPYSMFCYCQGDYSFSQATLSTVASMIVSRQYETQYKMWIDVHIKDDQGDKIVRHMADYSSERIPIAMFRGYPSGDDRLPKSWGSHLFYPNINAYKMLVWDTHTESDTETSTCYCKYELKAHPFLNGASHFIGVNTSRRPWGEVAKTPSESAIVSDPNKVYTSEVNNPFYFPVTSINTIGTGEIYGISSAVKALSQGQFGQFPMYVFASDGVWALETSATGTFVAKQPVTRDVCNCPESITQLDGAVLFSTQRGIMMLQGATTTCISIDLDADSQDTLVIDELLTKFGYPIPHHISFKEYIKDCRMVYDYIKQRIIVLNPSYDYAYVYSLKSQKWTTMESNMYSNINSYPDALVVMRDGSLADLNNVTDDTIKATLVTRAIKLGGGDILKTMKGVYQRGLIPVDGVSTILYGSRDYINWHPVSSSAITKMTRIGGTPYKAFRLATLIDFKKGNSLFGVTTEFETRFNNKIR